MVKLVENRPFAARAFEVSPDQPIEIWFTKPLGFVTFFSAPYHLEARGARWIAQAYSRGCRALSVEARRNLSLAHLWSNLTGFDIEAHKALINWAQEIREDLESMTLVLRPGAHTRLRMAAHVASSALSATRLPVNVHYTGDVATIVSDLGLRTHDAS